MLASIPIAPKFSKALRLIGFIVFRISSFKIIFGNGNSSAPVS
jgi:hypothetical protein